MESVHPSWNRRTVRLRFQTFGQRKKLLMANARRLGQMLGKHKAAVTLTKTAFLGKLWVMLLANKAAVTVTKTAYWAKRRLPR